MIEVRFYTEDNSHIITVPVHAVPRVGETVRFAGIDAHRIVNDFGTAYWQVKYINHVIDTNPYPVNKHPINVIVEWAKKSET